RPRADADRQLYAREFGPRGPAPLPRGGRRPGAAGGRRAARVAALDHRGQRDGVHLAGARCLGVLESCPARLQSTRETGRQLLDRGLQWLAATRVSLATLVCLDRRGPARSEEHTSELQSR